MRMASLRVFVCLLALVVLCHSSCTFEELEVKDLRNPPEGCVDKDGQQHAFGSTWVKACMECSCTNEGLSCCSMLPDAGTVELPEDCELVLDRATCSAKVVMKSDKTKVCNPN